MTDTKYTERIEKLRKALSTQELDFVDKHLAGVPADLAYQEAGLGVLPDPIGAGQLLAAPAVKMYIDAMQREIAERSSLTLEKIDERLTDLATANIIDMVEIGEDYTDDNNNPRTPITLKDPMSLTPGQRAAIVGLKTVPGGMEIKIADPIKALELLAKRRGGFTEQIDVNLTGNVSIFANVGDNQRGPAEPDDTDD